MSAERAERAVARQYAWCARSVMLAAFLAALVWCAPASALSQRGHAFGFSFAEGHLSKPSGVAVNEATGVVYVVDAKRVAEFKVEGQEGTLVGVLEKAMPALAKPTAVAVDNSHPEHSTQDPSAGAVYVVDAGHVDKFNAEGKFVSVLTSAAEEAEFGRPQGVAVDASGNVWVAWSGERYSEFSDEEPGKLIGEPLLAPEAGSPQPGFAVDSQDNLYVNYIPEAFIEELSKEEEEGTSKPCTHGFCFVAKLNPAGEVVNPGIDNSDIAGLTVELSTNPVVANDVYVDETHSVAAFTPAGSLIQRFAGKEEAGQLTKGVGVAVDAHTETVFVVDAGALKVDAFTPEPVAAPTIDESSAGAIGSSTATLSALVDPRGDETAVSFEYGTAPCGGGGCTAVPVTGTLLAVFEDKSVEGKLEGLTPGTVYHYRVTASNGVSKGPTISTERTFTTQPLGGSLVLPDNRAWELVSPSEANGAVFESIPNEGGLIQAAESGNAFTFISTSPDVKGVEGNRSPTFTQILATRAAGTKPKWSSEDISIPNEHPQGVQPGQEQEYQFFSSDLSQALVQPLGPHPYTEPKLSPANPVEEKEFGHPQEQTDYVRNNQECAPPPSTCYTPLVTAHNAGGAKFGGIPQTRSGVEFEVATPDLKHAVIRSEAALTSDTASERNIYEWNAEGSQLQLVNMLPEPEVHGFEGEIESGHLTEIIATTPLSFLSGIRKGTKLKDEAGAIPSGTIVIKAEEREVEREGKKVKRGFIIMSAPATAPHAQEKIEASDVAALGANAGSVQGFIARHAISNDGSNVFWTAGKHLYLRNTTTQKTVQVDLNESGQSESTEAHFQTASTDGSRVFFTDDARLVKGSSASEGKRDLYVFNTTEGKLTDVSIPDFKQSTKESARVLGIIPGASEEPGEDGTTVYFVANGVLTRSSEVNENNESATPGRCTESHIETAPPNATCNLYVAHLEGGTWNLKFIATLSSDDLPDWENNNLNLNFVTSRVSPNGRFLAFMSDRSLTAYDNRDTNELANGARDEEVFLYDRAPQGNEHALVCASCNPTKQRPAGVFDEEASGEGLGLLVDRVKAWEGRWLAASIPGWTNMEGQRALYQSRYLSDSGRLFFDSADALVPQAVGDTREETIEGKPTKVGIENVYEYEPNNNGTCHSEEGCISLMSSGSSSRESAFLDASVTGNDLFLISTGVEGTEFNIYDARVCTSESPCESSSTSGGGGGSTCNSSESCKGSPSPAPGFSAPASSASSGAGNVVPAVTPRTAVLPTKVVTLTRAQRLAKALKACRKIRAHKRRAVCEAQARKRFGARTARHASRHGHTSSKGKR